MNKTYFFLSLFIIVIIHYFLLTILYEKKVTELVKPRYNKISVQLAMLQIPTSIREKVKKENLKQSKKEIEKKVFNKPINEKAKRKLIKEETPKKLKKELIKEPIKKLVKKSEKIVKKKVEKQDIKKPIVKKVSISKKEQTQSLEKFKEYKKNYMTELRAAIDSNKKYPVVSMRLKQEGLVTISFIIFKSGLFKGIKIYKSSGNSRLDKAALKAVQLTAKFKPFPKEIYKEFLELKIPIKFQILK